MAKQRCFLGAAITLSKKHFINNKINLSSPAYPGTHTESRSRVLFKLALHGLHMTAARARDELGRSLATVAHSVRDTINGNEQGIVEDCLLLGRESVTTTCSCLSHASKEFSLDHVERVHVRVADCQTVQE